MGLTTTGLDISQKAIITNLGPEIVYTLRRASLILMEYTHLSKEWFGDESALWLADL